MRLGEEQNGKIMWICTVFSKTFVACTRYLHAPVQFISRRSVKNCFANSYVFFDDIDYSEEVEYIGVSIPLQQIREFLIDVATTFF